MNDARTRMLGPGLVFVLCAAAGSAAIAAAAVTVGRGALCVLLVPAVVAGFAPRVAATPRLRAAWLGVVAATILVFGAHSLRLTWGNATHPQEWDVQIFSLYGRFAAQGLNPYDHGDLRTAGLEGSHSQVFVGDLLGNGFPGQGEYAPPLLFLFRPFFGTFELPTATKLWYLAGVLVVAADVLLLRRLVLPGSGGAGLVAIAALVLAFRPTQATIALGQYNFLALLTTLLYWRDRARTGAGLWLGLSVVVRLPLAPLLLHPLRGRRWGTAALAGATIVGLWGAAAAFFGPATLTGYAQSFAVMPPAAVFAETINQSLYGFALRTMHVDTTTAATLLNPIYLGGGAVLAAVTIGLLWWLPSGSELAPGLLVPLGLVLHPSILEHYSVLLLFPVLLAWSRARSQEGPGLAAGFLTLVYALVGVGDGQGVFFATALCWLWSAWAAVRDRLAAPARGRGNAVA